MTTPGRAILGTAGQIAGNLAQVNNDAAAQYSSQLYNFVQSAFESPEKFEPDSDFMKQVWHGLAMDRYNGVKLLIEKDPWGF